MLPHIKGVAWEYADIVPDYQVGLSSGVLFLSLKYHRLHPEYICTLYAYCSFCVMYLTTNRLFES